MVAGFGVGGAIAGVESAEQQMRGGVVGIGGDDSLVLRDGIVEVALRPVIGWRN